MLKVQWVECTFIITDQNTSEAKDPYAGTLDQDNVFEDQFTLETSIENDKAKYYP